MSEQTQTQKKTQYLRDPTSILQNWGAGALTSTRIAQILWKGSSILCCLEILSPFQTTQGSVPRRKYPFHPIIRVPQFSAYDFSGSGTPSPLSNILIIFRASDLL
ncbi:hypothetical protein AX774_g1171 [Zancudomyces culisetae]|uniref:Uncharacterized protein n=1 Tax=Zancudomyces culisetae TaxID=1213189 RepID=A0A1R1PWN5_ZANCU|nr:hypothetical protein AX774_g1171 [Zancudomyces culisetae]|eukprot:OMH85293.1 hypothetical protein AX774_g1171 [Zancudomyces culisetae]